MTAATKEREKTAVETRDEASKQIAPGDQGQTQSIKQESQTPRGVERTRTGRVYTPPVDIYETGDAIVLVADMPGVDEASVDVMLEKNVLTIYGRVEPNYPEGHTLAYSEYGIGDYQRSFTISNQIDWEHIEGTVKDGTLTLTLPKAGPAEAKKIAIKST